MYKRIKKIQKYEKQYGINTMNQLIWAIIWSLIEFVIVTVFLWFFGGDIQYKIIRQLNGWYKNRRDTLTKVTFSRFSDHTYEMYLDPNFKEKIHEIAIENQIMVNFAGNDIEIIKMEYGTKEYSGKVFFSFHDYKELEVSQLSIVFSKECGYSTLENQIFSLVEATKHFESLITPLFPQTLIFTNELETKLGNLKMMTYILKLLNKVSKKEVFQYLYLKDKMFVEIDNDTLILRNQIDDDGLALFKEMITMYQ